MRRLMGEGLVFSMVTFSEREQKGGRGKDRKGGQWKGKEKGGKATRERYVTKRTL